MGDEQSGLIVDAGILLGDADHILVLSPQCIQRIQLRPRLGNHNNRIPSFA